jgi:NADPH:quinone reductase-like Zn-dependent oxidoreductase
MKALRFERTGSLDELHLSEMDTPSPRKGELLIKVRAAAINPSDVKNVLGKMEQTVLPRIPGRDFAGVVLQGSESLVGQEVFGTGGDLGFLRDGSHAEYLVVPSDAAVPKPSSFSFEEAAAFGLGYMAAWYAVVTTAQINDGETILIIGVTGAVGSAAARIASDRGARVIGTIRSWSERTSILDLPVDDYLNLSEESLPEAVMSRTSERGVDVVLDVVGGPMFEPCVCSLALKGRHVVIANTGDPRVAFNLVDFYHREGRILGVDTLKLTFSESADILRGLLPGIEKELYPAPHLETCRLEDAVEAYRHINSGAARKKIVIVN